MINEELLSLIESTQKIIIYPELVKVSGSLSSGLILSQLVYWMTKSSNGKKKTTIERDGKFWVALSHTQMELAYGLSRKECRTAIDKLINLGVVEKQLWKYKGSPTLHLSLVCNQLQSLLSGLDCDEKANPLCATGHLIGPTGPNLYIEEILINTISDEKSSQTSEDTKMTEIEQALKKLGEVKSFKPTTSSLAILWKKRLSVGGEWVKDLTSKQQGQLKAIQKALGGDSVEVFDYSLQNWSKFAIEVKSAKGYKTIAEKPEMGVILSNVDILMNMYQSSIDKPNIKEYYPEVLMPQQEVKKKEEVYIAPSQEIIDAMEALEKLSK